MGKECLLLPIYFFTKLITSSCVKYCVLITGVHFINFKLTHSKIGTWVKRYI